MIQMAHAAFDTLSAAQRLEKEFGFPPKQAEGTAKLVHEHLVGTVATKDDIAAVKGELKAEIAAVKSDVAAVKDDVAAVKDDVKALDAKIGALDKRVDTGLIEVRSDLKWLKGIGAAIVAALVLPWLAELAARALN